MADAVPRIVGTGRKIPEAVRLNKDPIFDWLHENPPPGSDLFQGFHARRVLSDDKDVADIMVPAALAALADAGLDRGDVDLLMGSGSISPHHVPNVLSEVHHRLNLDRRVWSIPVTNSFSEAPAAIMMADALIRAGRCETVLLVFGDNWTRYVSYRTPQAVSAADGAAALVMARSSAPHHWTLVDQFCESDTSYYGTMIMAGAPLEGQSAPEDLGLVDDRVWSHPFFQINARGLDGFRDFGQVRAPNAVLALLKRNGVDASETCLISHQASSVLMDYWAAKIGPGHYVNTLADYANLVLCSVPFNLSHGLDTGEITQDWLVMLCVGPDMHANAMLLRRG